jgi:acetyl esterase
MVVIMSGFKHYAACLISVVSGGQVSDHLIEGADSSRAILVRVYQPSEGVRRNLLVYFHGGAFQVGSIESHDGVCRRIALRTEVCMHSVMGL